MPPYARQWCTGPRKPHGASFRTHKRIPLLTRMAGRLSPLIKATEPNNHITGAGAQRQVRKTLGLKTADCDGVGRDENNERGLLEGTGGPGHHRNSITIR